MKHWLRWESPRFGAVQNRSNADLVGLDEAPETKIGTVGDSDGSGIPSGWGRRRFHYGKTRNLEQGKPEA
jgi:hypothetical protein